MPAHLECITCHKQFPINQVLYQCSQCNDLLDVAYTFGSPDPKRLKVDFLNRKLSPVPQDQSGVWRFRELLPFLDRFDSVISLREGNTPLWEVPRVAREAGLQHLAVKHQGMNPTGSFKDNGMTTAITQAKLLGARTVLCASTGNTSASMAAYAARADIRAVVLIPEGQIARGKLAQAIDYGATVVQIQGNFDHAMQLVRELSGEGGAYLLNSINPFRIEGQKTIVIELMEQRGWRPPDRIVLPAGNLGNCSAFGKALREMFDLKLISRLPKLTLVQAAGANPFAQMIRSGSRNLIPMQADTLATAIKIGSPVSWKKALRALEWTHGDVVEVTEGEIADSRALLARDGVGCEPASASTLAAILKLSREKKLMFSEEVVAILTGHHLKDPEYILEYHEGKLSHKGAIIPARYQNSLHTVAAESQALKKLLFDHDK
ncbi:MAG: threonine synthase [Acidobacteriia bacterium]|nr:threonine synthase [Terriglobia bacterium]